MSSPPNMLTHALDYAERMKWLVFPVHTPVLDGGPVKCSCGKGAGCKFIGKHPRWTTGTLEHGHNSATTDPSVITSWWTAWPDANIGIATGPASGLVVLDDDPRNGGNDTLAELEARHGKMPATIQTLTGGGGTHDYFLHPGAGIYVKSKDGVLGPGIDVKGDGGYIVAPPSLHRSGKRYAWEWSSLPGEVNLAPLPDWMKDVIEIQKESISPSTALQLCDSAALLLSNSASLPLCISITPDLPAPVADLIRRTLPSKPGTRRAHVMRFARGLKFDLGYGGTPPASLKPWVMEWHQHAWPRTSRTKTSDETWFDFLKFWEDARFGLDCDLAAEAMRSAQTKPIPNAARQFTDPRVQMLVGICRELQAFVGPRPFSLSSYQAGKLLGVHNQQAWRWLHGLVATGVLECMNRGRAGPGGAKESASRWRYLGD